MIKLQGILPPMITPFTKEGAVDYAAFEFNMKKWAASSLEGFLVLGSNSETAYLNEEEKLRLVKIAADNANGKLLMCGTGMETARDTIELTNKAADLGAQCALILTPNYYSGAMSTPALLEFFTEVADGCKIPVLVYNVPKFTHVNVGADFIAQIAKHPNIIGMKDSTGDAAQLANFIRVTKCEDFGIFVGTASILYQALTVGACGGILALANCNPEECADVYKAVKSGDHKAAVDTYMQMLPVNTAVTATFGIAGLKTACTMLGFQGGYVRSPLQNQNDVGKEGIKKILAEAGVL